MTEKIDQSPPERCLRCPSTELLLEQQHESVAFYCCPRCSWPYAKAAGKTLTDRWMTPLSILLYPAMRMRIPRDGEAPGPPDMLSSDPQSAARYAAAGIRSYTEDEIRIFIDAIHDELSRPKQQLLHMHDFHFNTTEEHLREYLRALGSLLEEKLKAGTLRRR